MKMRLKWAIGIPLGLWVLALLMAMFLGDLWLFAELPLHLLFGWIIHGYKAIGPLLEDWPWLLKLAIGIGLTGAALSGVLRYIRPLRFMHSLAVVIAALMLFASACASIATVHHLVWLPRVEWVNDGLQSNRSKNYVRHLIMALQLYAGDHDGDYPPSLDVLVAGQYLENSEARQRTLWMQRRDGSRVPWTYLPGLANNDPLDLPVILSPGPVHTGKYIIAKNDGSVSIESESVYLQCLEAYRAFLAQKYTSQGQNQTTAP